MTDMTTPRTLVCSGLIVAEMSRSEDGITFHGPLTFDGETVAAEGEWFHAVNPFDGEAVEDALCERYLALYDDWCSRKSFDIAPQRTRRHMAISPSAMHTPCPALWAGR